MSTTRPSDSVGVYKPASSAWTLLNHLSGSTTTTFTFGPANSTQKPVGGDWDGDGISTTGLYNYSASTQTFTFRNSNTTIPTYPDLITPSTPISSTTIPITGDWDGDGIVTPGFYDPATGMWQLLNYTAKTDEYVLGPSFVYGSGHPTWLPIAGDWNNDGATTIGLYDPSTGTWHLRNTNSAGDDDLTFTFGPTNSTQMPVTGDWNGDGITTVGLYNSSTGAWSLRNANSTGGTDVSVTTANGQLPVTGHWVAPGS